MNILVLYHSRTGNTQTTAEAIGRAARRDHHQAVVKSVIEVRDQDVKEADLIFVGTWVQGLIIIGVKPAGADLWVTSLPDFKGKPIATFCTYAFNPRRSLDMLGELLTRRGGHVIAERAFHRSQTEEGIEEFFEEVLASVIETID